MSDVLSITLHGMQQDMARMERIGMNVANALTPGYKREIGVARSFADHLFPGANEPAERKAEAVTDLQTGALRQTGRSLDLAVSGPGFFEVATARGTAYTRQGNFHVDPQGRLVTAHGYPVMGESGEIVLNGKSPAIDHAGFVSETDPLRANGEMRIVDRLKIVSLEGGEALIRLGDGLISSMQSGDAAASEESRLHQGFLESSNVNALDEMVQLMQTMRHFESMQKALQGYDEMVGAAIRKLGEA